MTIDNARFLCKPLTCERACSGNEIAFSRVCLAVCQLRYCFATPSFIYSAVIRRDIKCCTIRMIKTFYSFFNFPLSCTWSLYVHFIFHNFMRRELLESQFQSFHTFEEHGQSVNIYQNAV